METFKAFLEAETEKNYRNGAEILKRALRKESEYMAKMGESKIEVVLTPDFLHRGFSISNLSHRGDIRGVHLSDEDIQRVLESFIDVGFEVEVGDISRFSRGIRIKWRNLAAEKISRESAKRGIVVTQGYE